MAAGDHFVITEEVKWKAFLQLNRTRMVTDLDYDMLSREAIKRAITDEKEVKRVKFNSTANFRRVGVFLDNLLKKTKEEYLLFRECLRNMDEKAKAIDDMLTAEYPEYEESLKRQMQNVRPRKPRDRPRGDATPLRQFENPPCAAKEEIEEVEVLMDMLQPPDIPQSTQEFYERNKADSYKIGHGRYQRGRVLLVTMTGNRDGWKQDVLAMAKLFKSLRFEIKRIFDPKHTLLKAEMRTFSFTYGNDQTDCVFIVFMGHGGRTAANRDYLITADGCAFMLEEEVQACFNNDAATFLQEKPKVIISQMCRGDSEDQGVIVTDANPFRKIPSWTDFLFGYATLPGNKAYRDDKAGSWYIQEVANIFMEHAHDQSVPDMLTKVNKAIDEKNPDIKQATVMTISLNHKFFLFPDLDYVTLAEQALQRGLTQEEDVKRIKFNNTANFRRVGVFLDNLLKKTKTEYLLFLDCLEQMDDKAKAVRRMLIDDFPAYERQLEEQMRNIRRPRRDRRDRTRGDALPQFPAKSELSPEILQEVLGEIDEAEVPGNFKHSSKEFYDKIKGDCYRVGRKLRGRVLMVTMTAERDGWRADVKALAELFRALKFDIVPVFDPTHQSLQSDLQRFAESKENENADCVFVVVMAHGDRTNSGKDYIITRDGCPFMVEEEIQQFFNNKDAVYLREKPKVFIMQKCRGTNRDRGVILSDAEACLMRKLPTWSDFLFGHSTLPGNEALRDTKEGSWYIQELVRVFLEHAHNQSVMDMLTKVNRALDLQDQEFKQATVLTASLNHKFFLFPGI